MNIACPVCYEDHPCWCELKSQQEKTWIDYRIEEMEEKANFVPVDWDNLPEKDMDGCSFTPYFSEEDELKMDDAYYRSLSKRLYHLTIDITGYCSIM